MQTWVCHVSNSVMRIKIEALQTLPQAMLEGLF